MAYLPTRSIMAASTASLRRRWSMASCMVKQRLAALRHAYCTGMRTILALLTAATIAAQTPARPPADQDAPATIKVDVDIVNILASVRDKRGALVPSLEKKDFTIF